MLATNRSTSLALLFSSLAALAVGGCKSEGGNGTPGAGGGGTTGAGGSGPGTGGRAGAGGSGSGAGGTSAPGGSGGTTSPSGSGGTASGSTGGTTGSGGSTSAGTGGAAGDANRDTPMGTPDTPGAAGAGFRIYWIDVEGGAATLLISPTGQSLLADAGWESRDAARIAAVLQQETGAKTLDFFLATHYHVDHVSGAPALAGMVKINNFIDHGPSVEGGNEFNQYQMAVRASMAEAKRMTAQPGTKVMLGGVELTILTAGGRVVTGLPTAVANPGCANFTPPVDQQDEDPQSVGFVARYGKFEFVDLGDLTGGVEHKLVCPMNQVGQVDLFQASQHGSNQSNIQPLATGFEAQVVVFNNGASKGGDAAVFQRFRSAPGIKDVWAMHKKASQSAMQNADDALIANPGGSDMANWLKATVQADGTFTMTNGGTKLTRTYQSR
ncbi:MAG TPA: MBL fold metallo-hydrolase [Polyangia bacterium]